MLIAVTMALGACRREEPAAPPMKLGGAVSATGQQAR